KRTTSGCWNNRCKKRREQKAPNSRAHRSLPSLFERLTRITFQGITMSTYANYINGQWVDSSKTTRNINPADLSDVIGQFAQATEQDTQAAIAAARQAAPAWGLSTPQQR